MTEGSNQVMGHGGRHGSKLLGLVTAGLNFLILILLHFKKTLKLKQIEIKRMSTKPKINTK